MRVWTAGVVAAVICLQLARPHEQRTASPQLIPATQESDRRNYLGPPVTHPEAFSGVWESPDGQGGAVGIHLLLTTTVPGNGPTLADAPQSLEQLDVGVYQRKGPVIQFGEENLFSGTRRGGSVTLEDGHLLLYSVAHLDLVQQAGDQWVGRLLRGDFDSTVKLRRPGLNSLARPNSVVGTWQESWIGNAYACLHIVQQAENSFMGWSDSVTVPSSSQCPNGLTRVLPVVEQYGDLMKVHVEDGRKISFELHAYNAICCSATFIGTISQDGTLIQGRWPAGPNQSERRGTWKKVAGDSCVNQTPSPTP